MDNIEIEVKLKIENPKILLNWLKQNAEFVGSSDQTDYYFDPPHKSYIYQDQDGTKDADEWLRIRESNQGNEICYKFWHRDPATGRSLYADEIETSIGSHTQLRELFRRVGFTPTSTIKKHRQSYRWGEFQFDFDDVEGLGLFVEVEFKGTLEDPAQGREKIFSFLASIGVTDWKKTKRGYSWIQWNPDKNHFEI